MFTCKNIFCIFFSWLEIKLIRFANFNESTVWITSNRFTAFLALFLCRCPMRCSSIFFLLENFLFFISVSWIRLSPIVVRLYCKAVFHIPGGNDLVTATIVLLFWFLPDLIAALCIWTFTCWSFFPTWLWKKLFFCFFDFFFVVVFFFNNAYSRGYKCFLI